MLEKIRNSFTPGEFAWVLYDVANSAFTMLATTLIPIWFKVLAITGEPGGLTSDEATGHWALSAERFSGDGDRSASRADFWQHCRPPSRQETIFHHLFSHWGDRMPALWRHNQLAIISHSLHFRKDCLFCIAHVL